MVICGEFLGSLRDFASFFFGWIEAQQLCHSRRQLFYTTSEGKREVGFVIYINDLMGPS